MQGSILQIWILLRLAGSAYKLPYIDLYGQEKIVEGSSPSAVQKANIDRVSNGDYQRKRTETRYQCHLANVIKETNKVSNNRIWLFVMELKKKDVLNWLWHGTSGRKAGGLKGRKQKRQRHRNYISTKKKNQRMRMCFFKNWVTHSKEGLNCF